MKMETKISVGLIFLFRVRLNSIDSIYNGRPIFPAVLQLFIHTYQSTTLFGFTWSIQDSVLFNVNLKAFISPCIHLSSLYLVPFNKSTKWSLWISCKHVFQMIKKSCCGKSQRWFIALRGACDLQLKYVRT